MNLVNHNSLVVAIPFRKASRNNFWNFIGNEFKHDTVQLPVEHKTNLLSTLRIRPNKAANDLNLNTSELLQNSQVIGITFQFGVANPFNKNGNIKSHSLVGVKAKHVSVSCFCSSIEKYFLATTEIEASSLRRCASK